MLGIKWKCTKGSEFLVFFSSPGVIFAKLYFLHDIGNDIICKFCKLVLSRFKDPSISSDALES